MKQEKNTRQKQNMKQGQKSRLFLLLRGIVKAFYPVPRLEGLENLPEGPFVLVGNHAQMNGPIISELYVPGKHYTWCAGEMMDAKQVPDYAYRDFWRDKPKAVKPFFRLLSYLIAPLSELVFTNADCIGVYRDQRIVRTLKNTVNALADGATVVIFPECPEKHNSIICEFQEGFVDVAALFAKKEGKSLPFVPMYIAPSLKKVVFGQPVLYDPEADHAAERTRVSAELMDRITALALALPPHVVIPYENVRKREYPMSR